MAKILDRHNNLIFKSTSGTLKETVEEAVQSGVSLRNAYLSGADLRGATLIGADLSDAHLDSAKLKGANLGGANLSGADLTYSNLVGADLEAANLTYTDFRGADLEGANLRDVELWDTLFEGANLKGTIKDRSSARKQKGKSADIVMSEDQWANKFRPYDLDGHGSWLADSMYEIDAFIEDNELEIDKRMHLWTLVDSDEGGMVIVEGVRRVNANGYYLTMKPRKPGATYIITDED